MTLMVPALPSATWTAWASADQAADSGCGPVATSRTWRNPAISNTLRVPLSRLLTKACRESSLKVIS
ncbi:hypothetical protein D3C86_1844980 [compost metagenome]